MAVVNLTSLAGLVLAFYLSTFVLFALIRIATGVSIQRIGYLSLRRIAFTPKEGVRIELRGLGLNIHRPTFAQPTWLSLRLTELHVTIDPSVIQQSRAGKGTSSSTGDEGEPKNSSTPTDKKKHENGNGQRSQLWRRLTEIKEKIKRLHRKIHWICLLDLLAVNTTIDIVNVGRLQIGIFSLAVDTRQKMVDRGKLWRHKKEAIQGQRPAEWIIVTKSILLSLPEGDTVEVLDSLSVNIHGLLSQEKEGLRDASVSLKLGRLHIPLDEIMALRHRFRENFPSTAEKPVQVLDEDISFTDVAEELDKPGSREETIVKRVADSKEFISSLLRGIHEIQMALSWIRVSRRVQALPSATTPLFLNIVLHEIGIDLHRLDPRTPAHRMYFSRDDIAHQALVAAISISVSLDESETRSSKLLYIPMATATIRTTLPSKTVTFSEHRDVNERNANVLFSNLVITSPSVDLEPRHLPQLLTIIQRTPKSPTTKSKTNHRLIFRLLPKLNIKLSIQEPVIRCVLPLPLQITKSAADDYDLLISSVSSISLDVESSHSTTNDQEYWLSSNLRVASHRLYYQSCAGEKHDLVLMDTIEVKTQLNAASEVLVSVSGILRTFTIRMVREEVSKGVWRIVKQFKNARASKSHSTALETVGNQSFLRRMPQWLTEIQFEGVDCGVEVAGVDAQISPNTRGLALQLDSWTAEYLSRKVELLRRGSASRRRTTSSAAIETPLSPGRQQHLGRKHGSHPTDGRRLAIHVRNLEGFIIESSTTWETEPFLSLPRFEVALSTSSDLQGAIFHINSYIRALLLHVSLYRYYSLGVAGMIVKEAFVGPPSSTTVEKAVEKVIPSKTQLASDEVGGQDAPRSHRQVELVTVDVKASLLQVKAQMPHDPMVLLQVYDLSAGRHRWSAPFLRSHLIRLHAETPHLRNVWSRVVSVNNVRLDIRHSKRKIGVGFIQERSIDLATDFIRLAVPHGLTMHRLFDNFVNTLKSVSQLHHRFQTRSNEYILEKHPEPPKHVPKISVRSKALMFELEDDPFEWKLGLIYHIGLLEQAQRLAREEAFKAKVRKIDNEANRRASSRYRNQSRPERYNSQRGNMRSRSRSEDIRKRDRSSSRGRQGLRYDPDGICDMSSNSRIGNGEAWRKLQEHNARSWKRRIDGVYSIQNSKIKAIRRMFAGADEPPHEIEDHETILAIPNRPGLMTTIISDIHLMIDKPSFPLGECSDFLHKIGKGMPYDMQYTLLMPMHIKLDMGEARVMLRDYPLNLLHIPALRPGQPSRLPSWSLNTDFVIAEEFRDYQSTRHVKVDIIPPTHDADGNLVPGFALDVRRTVSPVKTYSDVAIDINTNLATTISWGTSYQPVIQDMMMIIENFTKPEVDPSDRVGFWDKIRLSFHSRINVNWKGDGDVQLRLKGSRDPYVVTGYGAGFVMCWRNDVQWEIHTSDNPRKFMTVTSGEYVLAIPDYSRHARMMAGMSQKQESESGSTSSSQKNAAVFQKVVMKLSGNVQWIAGLVFERNLPDGGRSFDFRPHHEVRLRNPKYLSEAELKDYDAFRGFRSDHIHLSIGVSAPWDREWTSTNSVPSKSYNTVHLTPKFFTHFYDWWSLFSGVMSLPIRQGKLWRSPEKKSKKFGRHLATIKYNLLLSPLFIAHIYKHKDAEEYNEEIVSATGLKIRLDSFMLDLHQRREQFDTLSKNKIKQTRTSGMRINKAQVDFISADIRAVSANIGGTTAEDLMKANDEYITSLDQHIPAVDISRFTIPDHDLSWIDMDDFVELDWVLPAESNPETHILPLAYSPRFTYLRETDHHHIINGDTSRTSPFGDEPTHFCVMNQDNDPRRVQMTLLKERLNAIDLQIEAHNRLTADLELKLMNDGQTDNGVREQFESVIEQGKILQAKKKFIQGGYRRLCHQLNHAKANSPSESGPSSSESSDTGFPPSTPEMDGLYSSPNDEFASDFNNKFIVHNVQLKWSNSLRNIILRYTHQVSQRRGFVYYMSRRAVKFILDIVEEQNRNKAEPRPDETRRPSRRGPSQATSPTDEKDEDSVVQDRIEQLLNDAKRFVNADDDQHNTEKRPSTAEGGEQIANDFTAQNSYHIRLIAPQIQLQSEKNTKSVALVTAKGMQLKIISIMDRARLSDNVSGLVQRRFMLEMDGAQFFVSNQKRLYKYLHLYSGNKYGNAPGSAWPPWVPVEVMFDFELNPFGFQRVIQKTSASLHYEKYNNLRLKYNEQVAAGEDGQVHHPGRAESRVDHVWVDFPRVRAICDSAQYYAMYIIVLDLLLYSEPLEKIRSERLEKIMLASDFSDLRGAPEMASKLQERIRQLEAIKTHFQVNAKLLDRQGWQDRIDLEKDLANCEDELFFIMKAITTSQRKNDERKTSQSTGLVRWYLSASEIVWHLMKDKNEPLVEIQLRDAAYERVDNSDGSNHNAMEIKHIHGLNLLPNALYPEIISPFHDPNRKIVEGMEDETMFKVHWYMLEAIAGIPVLENFEVTLHPLKIQLERELGKKLFEYIFPQVGAHGFENGGFSPLMIRHMRPLDEDDDSDPEDMSVGLAPDHSSTPRTRESYESATRPGAMELRLKPTMTLPYNDRRPASSSSSLKNKGLGIMSSKEGQGSRFFFSHSNQSQPVARPQSARPQAVRKGSADNISIHFQPPSRSSTGFTTSSSLEDKPKKGFALARTTSRENNPKDKEKEKSDDISQMLSRASNYMTLAHVKINSVVLCLSYKGKGERNIEDVHDFVFRMPVLEYRNKTWSNLDLALRLRRDVTKALISHTGAIIGNKLSHHRPNKVQQNRLRELASSSQILPNTDSVRNSFSYTSTTSRSSPDPRAPSPSRSFNSAAPSPLSRHDSVSSSIRSAEDPSSNPSGKLIPWEQPRRESSSFIPNALGRRFTLESHRSRQRESTPEDSEEVTKKKTVLLLGKKILGSLS